MKYVWQAGIARVDISPPKEVDLGGYAARLPGNLGVHDPVFIHSLFIEDGRECIAFLVCDVLGFHIDDVFIIRQTIAAEMEIPPHNIFLIATHSHSAPATLPGNGLGTVHRDYFRWLKNKMVQSVHLARQNLHPVEIGFTTTQTDIAVNRRGKTPEGSIELVPDPTGPVDHQVSILTIKKQGKVHPWIVVFVTGCHPTVLGPENRWVSSDFPGTARKFLEDQLGNEIIAIFINGAAGNVNPIERGDFSSVEKLGKRLGEQVLKALETNMELLPAKIMTISDTLIWPFAGHPTLDRCEGWVKHYQQLLATAPGAKERRIFEAGLQWARQLYSSLQQKKVLPHVFAPVQMVLMGRLALLSIPAEVFVQTSVAIREKAPLPTIVMGYANGNFGYLPPRDEIKKGGYEVNEAHKYYNYPSHFAPEAEEKVRKISGFFIEKLLMELNINP